MPGSEAAGAIARGLIETNAGAAFVDVERRGEYRLLVVGVVAGPTIAEDLPADREAMRLLRAAPVIGRSRPPVIFEPDAKTLASGFDDGVGAVFDRQLRLETGGDAPGEKALLLFGPKCREGGEALCG
jgi:hypothetical protein